MSPTNHPGSIIPQDIEPGDASESFGLAEPYTQTEIEDLLYGDDRPASQRLDRLRELREQSAVRESGDWGDQDPAASIAELDRAIDELSAMIGNGDDNDDYAALAPAFDNDPGNRLDALSPDDIDAREAIMGEDADLAEEDDDEDDVLSPLDETEWDDKDGFDPEQGVR